MVERFQHVGTSRFQSALGQDLLEKRRLAVFSLPISAKASKCRIRQFTKIAW